MDGFTSTIMVRLLMRAIRDIDPDMLDGTRCPDPMDSATLPTAVKRALIGQVMDRHGAGPLLGIGDYLEEAAETPMAAVLLNSASADVLASKWMRLETYHHAHHRTRIGTASPGRWDCTRHSLADPAIPGENAMIAGVLKGLLRMTGHRGCVVEADGRVVTGDLPPGETLAQFSIRWTGHVEEAPGAPHGETDPRPVVKRLSDLLMSDMGRNWRIEAAAKELGLSARSLQRRLAEADRSFSTILRQARVATATRHLAGSQASLAEIGYCCGYADQAHFQRDFRRAANTTPRRYRDLAAG
ncbi:MAG: helix-turn-helix transcriptional regulator [Pseudooceanicola sp.]